MNTKNASRVVCLFAVVVFTVLSCCSFVFAENPIELTFNTHMPARSWGAMQEWGPWCKGVEAKCNGKLKINVFWGATLSSPMDAYDSAVMGVADMAYAAHTYTPGRFPLMSLFELPGFGKSMMASQHILYDLYKQFPEFEAEHKDVKVIWLGAIREMTFNMVAKRVHSIEDFKGLRIRASGGSTAETIQLWGGAPILMPITDSYMALQRNVVDGTTTDWNIVPAFKFDEVTKYATIAPVPGNPMFLVMNLKKWNALPKDIQDAILGEGERHWLEGARMADEEAYRIIQRYEKMSGHEVFVLPHEERERWLKAAQPVYDKWVADMEAKGYPGKKILDTAMTLAEKYNTEFPAPWYSK